MSVTESRLGRLTVKRLKVSWVSPLRQDISLRFWQDGTVVFDEASGHLHCLSPMAGQLLELVMTRPHWTTRDLVVEFIGENLQPEDEDLVMNALSIMTSSGLLKRFAD